MDDDDEYGYEEADDSSRRRFIKQDLIVIAADLAYEVSAGISRVLLMARNTAAMHANWVSAQHEFHQEAAKEIEALTKEGTDG